MSRTIASFFGLLLVAAGQCSTEPGDPPVPKSPWSLQLTTSGGFVGIGTGALTLNSDGNFEYEPPAPPGTKRKPCEGKLTSQQLQSVAEAVEQSQPNHWNQTGLNVAAPDAFGYKLELRTGPQARSFGVEWYDNTADHLPSDLQRLSETVLQVMKTTANKCQ